MECPSLLGFIDTTQQLPQHLGRVIISTNPIVKSIMTRLSHQRLSIGDGPNPNLRFMVVRRFKLLIHCDHNMIIESMPWVNSRKEICNVILNALDMSHSSRNQLKSWVQSRWATYTKLPSIERSQKILGAIWSKLTKSKLIFNPFCTIVISTFCPLLFHMSTNKGNNGYFDKAFATWAKREK